MYYIDIGRTVELKAERRKHKRQWVELIKRKRSISIALILSKGKLIRSCVLTEDGGRGLGVIIKNTK